MSALIDLDALVEAIAERVAAKLRQASAAPAEPPYYDARSAPCSRRRFLAAAARAEFPSFVDGNRVKAKRADVHAWLEARTRAPKRAARPPAAEVVRLDAKLDAALAGRRVAPRRRAGGE